MFKSNLLGLCFYFFIVDLDKYFMYEYEIIY